MIEQSLLEEINQDIRHLALLLGQEKEQVQHQDQHDQTFDTQFPKQSIKSIDLYPRPFSCNFNQFQQIMDQQPQFMTARFDKHYDQAFEKYVQFKQKCEQQCVPQQKLKDPNYKIKYIPKHKSPRTVFNYYGVDIQVIYQKFDRFRATCLVFFLQDMTISSVNRQISCKSLVSALKQEIDQENFKAMVKKEQMYIFRSRFAFKSQNYDFVYLIQKPQVKLNSEYSIKKMQDTVLGVFDKMCSHKTTKTVAFNDFFWPALSSQIKCKYFFWNIMNAIKIQLSKKRTNLEKVTICCMTQRSFMEFTSSLRQISDSYVVNGLININWWR